MSYSIILTGKYKLFVLKYIAYIQKIIQNVIGSFSGGMYTGRLGDLGDLVREVSYAKVFYLTSKFNI